MDPNARPRYDLPANTPGQDLPGPVVYPSPGNPSGPGIPPQINGYPGGPPAPSQPNPFPQYPAPEGPPGQFDFIMRNGQPVKKPGIGGSRNQRIIIVAALVLGLITAFVMLTTFLNRESNAALNNIEALTTKQAELIGTAGNFSKSRDQKTINYATTVYYGMLTSQAQTINYLGSHGRKLDARKLSALKNAEAEQALARAALNNTFDATLVKYLQTQLADYAAAVQTAQKSAASDAQKKLLDRQLANIKPLATNQAADAAPATANPTAQ